MSFKGEQIEDVRNVQAENEDRFSGDHWTLESHIVEVDAAAQAIRQRLSEAGWTDDEVGQFDVAVSEAITNAITHGNLGIEREPDEPTEAYQARIAAADASAENNRKVTVEITLLADSVTVVVEDEGKKEIDPDKLPDPTSPDRILKPGGRGIFSILKACDEVDLSAPGRIIMRKLKRTGDEIPQ
jgi:serine/threonine-protein kinase RsbW